MPFGMYSLPIENESSFPRWFYDSDPYTLTLMLLLTPGAQSEPKHVARTIGAIEDAYLARRTKASVEIYISIKHDEKEVSQLVEVGTLFFFIPVE